MSRGICRICGGIFNLRDENTNICDKCYEQERQYYQIVKEYLMQHVGASLYEVATNTKIPIRIIKRFIEENMIDIIE